MWIKIYKMEKRENSRSEKAKSKKKKRERKEKKNKFTQWVIPMREKPKSPGRFRNWSKIGRAKEKNWKVFFFSIESLYEKELHCESLSLILARHRRFILWRNWTRETFDWKIQHPEEGTIENCSIKEPILQCWDHSNCCTPQFRRWRQFYE